MRGEPPADAARERQRRVGHALAPCPNLHPNLAAGPGSGHGAKQALTSSRPCVPEFPWTPEATRAGSRFTDRTKTPRLFALPSHGLLRFNAGNTKPLRPAGQDPHSMQETQGLTPALSDGAFWLSPVKSSRCRPFASSTP